MKCRECSYMDEIANSAEPVQNVKIGSEILVCHIDAEPYEGFCRRWNEKYLLDANTCREVCPKREDSQR